ncbi:MAG: hypothetical protein J4N98_08065 [Chloroflexi bacterium]|nr:hypothetical protein [Chloroflexota bacterium]
MTTKERIDQLSEERSRLYRFAPASRRRDTELKQRVAEITDELNQLWDLRRRERIGRLDGIDLLVERSYARVYGDDYRDVVAPAAVEEEGQQIALVA